MQSELDDMKRKRTVCLDNIEVCGPIRPLPVIESCLNGSAGNLPVMVGSSDTKRKPVDSLELTLNQRIVSVALSQDHDRRTVRQFTWCLEGCYSPSTSVWSTRSVYSTNTLFKLPSGSVECPWRKITAFVIAPPYPMPPYTSWWGFGVPTLVCNFFAPWSDLQRCTLPFAH